MNNSFASLIVIVTEEFRLALLVLLRERIFVKVFQEKQNSRYVFAIVFKMQLGDPVYGLTDYFGSVPF